MLHHRRNPPPPRDPDISATNIQAFERDKARLEALKVHPAQPIREVIQHLLDEHDMMGCCVKSESR